MLGSVLLAFILRISGTVLWMLFSILIARTLSVEDFGHVFFAINLTLAGGGLAVMGYDFTVLRFAPRLWKDDDRLGFRGLVDEARGAVTVMGALVCGAMTLAAVAGLDTPVTEDWETALLVGLSIAATAQMAVYRDTLRSANRLQAALLGQSVVRAVVPFALCAPAALFGLLNVERALLAYLIGLLTALAWQHWQIFRLDLPPRQPFSLRHLRIALGIWPGDSALLLFQRAPGITIGLTGGMEAAALFLAADRIAQTGTFLTDAVRTAVAPMLSHSAGGEDRQRAVSQASILMAGSGLAGTVLLLLLGGLMLWAFGPAYRSAYPTLLMLLVAQLSWTVLGPAAMILNMFGAERERSLISVGATVLLLIALPFCGTAFSAALIYAVAAWAMNGLQWLLIHRRLGLRSGLFGIRRSDVVLLLAEEKGALDRFRKRFRKRSE